MPPDVLAQTLATPSLSLDALPTLAQAGDAVAVGPYLAWWKLLIVAIVFMVWARILLWIDKDSDNARLPREAINSGLWAVLVLGLIAMVFVPVFPVALLIFVALGAGSILGYLLWRKSVVGLDDIPDELAGFFKGLVTFGKKGGIKKKDKEKDVGVGAVTLTGANGTTPPVPEDDAPERVGYDTAHRMLADPLYKGAERITVVQIAGKPGTGEEGGDRFATKYAVDGFDYPGSAYDANAGMAATQFLKELAGLDSSERRKVQKGSLKARTAVAMNELAVVSSGSRGGESLVFEVDPKSRYKTRATALGMTPQQKELLVASVEAREKLVVLTAPPGGGLDALLYGMIHEHDAFTEHLIMLEHGARHRDLEGVTQEVLPEGADAAAERKQLAWIADQQPDVLLTDRVSSREGAAELIRLVREERRRAYVGWRAPDTTQAIVEWIKLVGEPRAAANALSMAIAGRVLRRLCDQCKVPYEPPEAVLAKIGVSKSKVRELFKARTEPMLDQRGNPVVCEACGGLGYRGRIGAFELTPLDDKARGAIAKDPTPAGVQATVKAVLRANKLPTINEAALRQVIAGRSDLQEVQRVMSGGSSGKPASKPRGSPTPSAA